MYGDRAQDRSHVSKQTITVGLNVPLYTGRQLGSALIYQCMHPTFIQHTKCGAEVARLHASAASRVSDTSSYSCHAGRLYHQQEVLQLRTSATN